MNVGNSDMNHRMTRVAVIVGLAAALASSAMLVTTAAAVAGTGDARLDPDELAGISVYFKLDPRLTQGLYMGDHWVSPPTYSRVGEGAIVTVDASARGVDGRGRSVSLRPEWRADDSRMVAVTPNQGQQVKITVLRPGKSIVWVTFQDVSRKLAVNATIRDSAMVVEIAQK